MFRCVFCGPDMLLSKIIKLKHRNEAIRSLSNKLLISDEVKCALESNKAVVALESTIITHGMPFPDNVKCALQVEDAVREHGAVPATVAIIEGKIRVGLTSTDLSRLGDVLVSRPIKTSRRDLAYVVSSKRNGGTTVSGTLVVANLARIPIFATGGIGGVHREGESTFDISADLTEMGRSGVAVVSSGVKSILDIAKTLEYLETQGVFVATYGSTSSSDFPAFYTRKSGFSAPYSVQSAREAAEIIAGNLDLDLKSGLLFAVPVPSEFSLDEGVINGAVEAALLEAKGKGIKGKEITPFLLGRIGQITAGKSLRTNVALVRNNAKCAAEIAVELAKLRQGVERGSSSQKHEGGKPVVIGGSNLDLCIKLEDADIKMDGRIHWGKIGLTPGGVGRNLSEALFKLGCCPVLISAVGKDQQGEILRKSIPHQILKQNKIKTCPNANTAQCAIVLDSKGDCKFLMGDMEIHREISPETIRENETTLKNSPLIVFDGNLTVPTIEEILRIANKYNVPAFFEPTDATIASKPFDAAHWRAIRFITPNVNELRVIAGHLGVSPKNGDDLIKEAGDMARGVALHIDNVIVTLGSGGLIVANKGAASEPFLTEPGGSRGVQVRHYPAEEITSFVNVSGAGDSLAGGLIAGFLSGRSEEECVSIGFAAAQTALFSKSPIAGTLFGKEHPSWRSKASFRMLN